MTNHITHERLPEGFTFADRLQVESFMQTGSVPGASKVCLVAGAGELPRLATRLRPPQDWTDSMRLAYKAGFRNGRVGIGKAEGTDPYVKGWLDGTWGRMKWHLAHCPAHHHGSDGCGVVG